ncbi:hypothetical protein [Niallia oryzisoli]
MMKTELDGDPDLSNDVFGDIQYEISLILIEKSFLPDYSMSTTVKE